MPEDLARFFDLSLEPLCIAGIDGRFRRINPAFEVVLGYRSEEILSRPLFELMHPDDRKAARAELGRLREGSAPIHFENRCICKDGSVRWLTWIASPATADGLVYAAARDMTRAREAELSLERLKADFVSTVTHELRTPLTSISGSLALLSSGVMGELNEEAAYAVKLAQRNSLRLAGLIDEILAFEKLGSKKAELELRPVALLPILERSIQAVVSFASEEGVTLDLQSPGASVIGDDNRIAQVVVNLLSNAVKFSHRGGVVTVSARTAATSVEVRVRDRGIGIPAGAQKDLFRQFHQIDSGDARMKSGTGLGLAICRAIIEQHGGEIGAESVEGEGSTFWFRVPAARQLKEEEVA